MRTLERINHSAIASLRTGATHENVDTVFQTAASSLEQFQPEEGLQWRREKFDTTFAKYIHKYFLSSQKKSAKQMHEHAYKDLHFMTTKYIELIGSVDFNAYLQSVINTKLNL